MPCNIQAFCSNTIILNLGISLHNWNNSVVSALSATIPNHGIFALCSNATIPNHGIFTLFNCDHTESWNIKTVAYQYWLYCGIDEIMPCNIHIFCSDVIIRNLGISLHN